MAVDRAQLVLPGHRRRLSITSGWPAVSISSVASPRSLSRVATQRAAWRTSAERWNRR